MITIYNFQAGYGDTFLVKVEREGIESVNLLIDCGFGFNKNVVPILRELNTAGDRINRMIITHFDNDHIHSAQKFLKQYTDQEKRIIEIDQIWLNAFRHLNPSTNLDTSPSQEDLIRGDAYLTDLNSKIQDSEEGDMGATQAINLGAQILKTGIAWNTDFGKKAACVENRKEIEVAEDFTILLLTPSLSMLDELKDLFVSDLRSMGIEATNDEFLDEALEVYTRWLEKEEKTEEGDMGAKSEKMSFEILDEMITKYDYDADDAAGNGSSIAFVLKAKEKQLLFLADAHAEDIMAALIREFPECQTSPKLFQMIKVAHHGSFRNNNPELHKLMDSECYVFSTNGKHQSHVHPDMETIVQIIHRPLPPGIEQRKLYFNYQLTHLAILNNPDLQRRYNFIPFYDQSFSI